MYIWNGKLSSYIIILKFMAHLCDLIAILHHKIIVWHWKVNLILFFFVNFILLRKFRNKSVCNPPQFLFYNIIYISENKREKKNSIWFLFLNFFFLLMDFLFQQLNIFLVRGHLLFFFVDKSGGILFKVMWQ